MKNNLSIWIQSFFYISAGANHFINPHFYLDLIPPYLPFHEAINVISGLIEVLLGIDLLFRKTRPWAAYGIIAMLIAFIPSHIYFIEIGGCIATGLCAPLWVGWLRLVIIHPLLIIWAWRSANR